MRKLEGTKRRIGRQGMAILLAVVMIFSSVISALLHRKIRAFMTM